MGQTDRVLGPLRVVRTPRWHFGGRWGWGRNREFRRAPEVTLEKKKTNVRLGESERTAALASLAIFVERAGCPRMHSSGPAVVSPCCFANSNYKDWQHSPTPLLPQAPHDPGHPLSGRALFPSPQFTKVTYSLAASSARRFGWGRKRGRRCVSSGLGGTPK